MAAMLEGQISSGASWPRKLAAEVCSLYQASPTPGQSARRRGSEIGDVLRACVTTDKHLLQVLTMAQKPAV